MSVYTRNLTVVVIVKLWWKDCICVIVMVLNHNKAVAGSSPALAWAPQVRVRKRIAQVDRNPGPRSPARPAGRRARGRKAPCAPLGAPRRLRTRKVPIPLLLCSLCFVLFLSTKHHFGASSFTDMSPPFSLSFQLCSFSAGENHLSLCYSHPTAISLVLKQLRISS